MQNEKIMYVDDEVENLRTMQRILFGKFEVTAFSDPNQALEACKKEKFDIILSDQRMPQLTGVEFLKKALPLYPNCLGIIVTAYSDQDALIEGINHGLIFRYITKPVKEADITSALIQAMDRIKLVNENQSLLKQLQEYNAYLEKEVSPFASQQGGGIASRGLKEVMNLVQKVAPTQSTVLIRGETGAGKEVVARMIHQQSTRKSAPFIRVNCGAITETLLESELFGHEKGSFTGATNQHIGKFESAHGGTIFLDEIGDISPKLQVSLLRVLQEKQIERVGGNKTIPVDVRVLAATHQNLEQMSAAKKFREDLFYRLNVFPITVPPLRDRLDDLEDLLPVILKNVSARSGMRPKQLHPSAISKIKSYDWPGNVREFENILERALILATEDMIQPEDILIPELSIEAFDSSIDTKELTKEMIEAALAEVNGNKVEAARRLGIKRPTLYYHLRRLQIG